VNAVMAQRHNNLGDIIGSLTKEELKESIPLGTIPTRCYASWRELSAAVLRLPDEVKLLIQGAALAKMAAATGRVGVNARLKRKRDQGAQRAERGARRGEGKLHFYWSTGKYSIKFVRF
jgi:hypothetical protein